MSWDEIVSRGQCVVCDEWKCPDHYINTNNGPKCRGTSCWRKSTKRIKCPHCQGFGHLGIVMFSRGSDLYDNPCSICYGKGYLYKGSKEFKKYADFETCVGCIIS